jgi:hypothetical protein
MEEKPPTQTGRDVPRSRSPRTTFGTPDQPTSPSKPAERAPRRSKAAPAVSFQAPANDESTSPDATPGRKPMQRRPQSGRTPAKKAPAAKATPPAKQAAEPAEPAALHDSESGLAKAAAKAAPPAKKAAAEPAKATPAKRPPKKAPQTDAATPRTPARAKKAAAKPAAASEKSAAPAQPAADATPPAKAMPAAPADVTEDPIPAQAMAAPADQPRPDQALEQRQPTALSKLTADPGHAPELLARAAVQTIGPRAKEWAERTREAYPKATDAALARLAADQFTRLTSPTSIVAALAGSFAPSALIATTALTHARVVLHVAAAYGLDPTDEARAADLLVLTRVYASREDAEAALSTTTQRSDGLRRIGRMIATNAAGWVAVRLVRRYFPGTSLVAAALVSRSSARNMAERANTYYSQASQALGRSV